MKLTKALMAMACLTAIAITAMITGHDGVLVSSCMTLIAFGAGWVATQHEEKEEESE